MTKSMVKWLWIAASVVAVAIVAFVVVKYGGVGADSLRSLGTQSTASTTGSSIWSLGNPGWYSSYEPKIDGRSAFGYADKIQNVDGGLSDISLGSNHALAIRSTDGKVITWGKKNSDNYDDLSLNGDKNAYVWPYVVPSLPTNKKFKQVSAGNHHSLALSTDGFIYSWGANNEGQLGNASTANSATPVVVQNMSKVSYIEGGDSASYAINDKGVYAWGSNASGALGSGSKQNNVLSATQVKLPTGQYTKVAASGGNAMALSGDGKVYTWGNNSNPATLPVQVTQLSGIKDIAAGNHYFLALDSSGTIWIWGETRDYLMKYTDSAIATTPIEFPPGKVGNVISIDAAMDHMAVLDTNGDVYMAGLNIQGETGMTNISSNNWNKSTYERNGTDNRVWEFAGLYRVSGEEKFTQSRYTKLDGIKKMSVGPLGMVFVR